jgi:hypothetical protein
MASATRLDLASRPALAGSDADRDVVPDLLITP